MAQAVVSSGSANVSSALSMLHSRHGLSLSEMRALGLTSRDLFELGVTSVESRLALLRMLKSNTNEETIPESTSRTLEPISIATALPTQDFVFIVSHFNSSRQFGKCLNIVVKYRYSPGTKANSTGGGYLDYREVRRLALKFAQPSTALPIGVQWEVINEELAKAIFAKYPSQIKAVSSQIQVLSEVNPYISEPGNHGSVITISDDSTFVPLEEPWVNAFRYDCTRAPPPSSATFYGPPY